MRSDGRIDQRGPCLVCDPTGPRVICPMRPTVTVSTFPARRLERLGVAHLFGLPGDFDLVGSTRCSRAAARSGPERATSSSPQRWRREMPPAGCAADGHARLRRGPAAFVTTSGVGELSAVDALVGSCAEDVPVVVRARAGAGRAAGPSAAGAAQRPRRGRGLPGRAHRVARPGPRGHGPGHRRRLGAADHR
ncbi:thiamine pyrophosphate-binding protein [Kineococcus sp. SYSU DK003]|uniref:thiamine pyrophosphate-binding protein n=1 Tax=Kineococcus sp. SYSU DK003 TaxID=3383124 RepID=UPI003D7D34FA